MSTCLVLVRRAARVRCTPWDVGDVTRVRREVLLVELYRIDTTREGAWSVDDYSLQATPYTTGTAVYNRPEHSPAPGVRGGLFFTQNSFVTST